MRWINRFREDRGDAASSLIFALVVAILGGVAVTFIIAGLSSTTAAQQADSMDQAINSRISVYVASVRAGTTPSTASLCYTANNWCVSVGSSTTDGTKRSVTVTAEIGSNTSTAVTQTRTVNVQAGNLIVGFDAAGNPVWGAKTYDVHLAASQVSLGGSACALNSGAAFCWGPDATGQRGDGFNQTTMYPTAVSGGHSFTAISTGNTVTCAIDNAKAGWCWGADDSGQRGDASTSASYTPTAVTGSHQFTEIAAGDKTVCGLDTAGVAWCWGDNTSGQLGNGTVNASAAPVQVAGTHTFSTLVVDGQNVCGLDIGKSAWCWGDNSNGQIGDGTTTNRNAPTAVAGGHAFTQLAMQSGTVCGIDAANVAWCWGNNGNGRTGTGSTAAHMLTASAVSGSLLTANIYSSPSGTWCLLTTQHKAYCWGANSSGQIGDGTTADENAPSYVGYKAHTFTQLAVGSGTVCGIDLNQLTWCWGDNTSGQLGDNSSATNNPNPGQVADNHLFTSITAHNTTMCALDANQRPWCWGGTTYRSAETGFPAEVLQAAPAYSVYPGTAG